MTSRQAWRELLQAGKAYLAARSAGVGVLEAKVRLETARERFGLALRDAALAAGTAPEGESLEERRAG